MTSLPAENLRLADRGKLQPGFHADVLVFDPARMRDTATFTVPYRYAEGMRHVFVIGTDVLEDGQHTGAQPGRSVLRTN